MGTNYYWRESPCPGCGRYDELHICKSLRSFQGHFTLDEDTWEYRPRLTSWADWKAHLRAGGEVWDEYSVRQDVEQFIADVEAVPLADRRRQYDWCRANWPHIGLRGFGVGRDLDWLDPDGFSFHGDDFS